ncbi:VanW family protein [Oscillibacter sp.]|jgi:vancomycin resistance protein YoaR|uniref:VanW family protein n=1 Tax=Oscillibacter sp. TaxID=1945593 RepID=UPI0021725654|nr:VanW family protein [Oscillibacter sp.]MCI9650144.1 hydrolase [Oscillibacter sp.]
MEQINEAVEKRAGGTRLKKKGGIGGPLLTALALTAAVGGGAYLGLCAYAVNSDAIWRNTYVLNQDIGGLTADEAVQKTEAALPDLAIGLQLYDVDSGPVDTDSPDNLSASIPLSDLGAEVDAAALVDYADSSVRSGPFLTAGYRYLASSLPRNCTDPSAIRLDPAKTAETAERVAGKLSWPALNTEYDVEETALLVRTAMDGRAVDAEDLEETLNGRAWAGTGIISFPCKTLPPARTMTAQDIHDAVSGEVKNAGYDLETNAITPEQAGADFDVPAAQAAMDAAEPGSTVRIAADIRLPSVTAEDLEELLFRDVLGEARTHVSGTAARISNVKLASAAFNGVVLNSGDVFSYNETVGQRTTAKGYKPAPAYVKGETVDEIGGGVCQPSSTLYLACLRANLEITERYAHRYVPAYIGKGMDATVSWGGPDYKFTNNTDYPIKIETVYEKGYLTVRILGTNLDGTYVKMTYEQLSSTPFEVVYEDDPALAPGEEVVKVTPYTGYKGRTYRSVYAADGTLISREYEDTSDYKVRNRVILRGPAEDPAAPVVNPDPGGPIVDFPPVETDPGTITEPPIQDPGTNPPIIVLPEDGLG